MRALVRGFDAALRQAQGVFEFCDDKACLFRLQVTRSRRDLLVCQGVLPKGSALVEFHLWNEHIPALHLHAQTRSGHAGRDNCLLIRCMP